MNVERNPARVIGTDIVKLEAVPDLLEAASLEGDVFVDVVNSSRETFNYSYNSKDFSETVPQGKVRIKISSNRDNLDTFWNTVTALREYDQPIPQS